MLPLNLDDLTTAHIQNLIDSEVAESLTLEYKSELPSDQSEKKREFLYDVAAMANAAGGDIVFGLVDRRGEDNKSTGVPERFSGMKLENEQSEISRLENLIRDGIVPRLIGISMRSISLQDGDVLVLRIPRSWGKPHMVTIGGVNRFCGRVSTGKYPMSVDEIGRAFSGRWELGGAIRKWRSKRTELALTGEGPIPTQPKVTFLFHAIPASALVEDVLRGSWSIDQQDKHKIYCPHSGYESRYNADGFLRFTKIGADLYGYTQVFRSGITEYADLFFCYPPNQNADPHIGGQVLEQQMVECYENALTRFRAQGRTEPLYIGFSLTGILNKYFYIALMVGAVGPTTQDFFMSPEVFVDVNDSEAKPYRKTLLPLVNTMWQLAGRESTPYTRNGEWDPFFQYD